RAMTDERPPRSARALLVARLGLVFALALAALPVACSDDESRLPGTSAGGSGGGSSQCIDADGDGFGYACPNGQDCDDADPNVTNECHVCTKPRPGCPCSTEGARTACGQVESKVGDQVTCGYGESVCTNGESAECIINNAVTLPPGGDRETDPHALGAPE